MGRGRNIKKKKGEEEKEEEEKEEKKSIIIAPKFENLHWLPIKNRVDFKMQPQIYSSPHTSLRYLTACCSSKI